MLLSNQLDLFIKLGFEIEDFGTNAIIIRGVPMILGKPQNFSFIYEILDEVTNNNHIDSYFEDTIIKRACKEAIKAKDKLEHSEIKKLIEGISNLKPPLTCPHGRPIILTMGKYEIEKYFKRIQ
jgi:DNA mismatch repair protein MutL